MAENPLGRLMEMPRNPARAPGPLEKLIADATVNPLWEIAQGVGAAASGYGNSPEAGAGLMAAIGLSPMRSLSKLPMNEASRMARAAEQGYTIDAYKGMYPYDWNTVPVKNWLGKIIEGANRTPKELTSIDANAFMPEAGRGAGFFSSSPDVASRFAQAMGESSVFPVKLKMTNPKVIDAEGKFAAEFQFGPGGNKLKLPKDSQHDGVILRNTRDEGDVYIPKTPDQIRSRWAAFDPANAGSGALLGSLAALMAGGNNQAQAGQ